MEDEDSVEIPLVWGHCEHCGGPINYGDLISYRYEGDKFFMSHRFSTWCDYFKAMEAKFIKDCGIAVEGDNNGSSSTDQLEYIRF